MYIFKENDKELNKLRTSAGGPTFQVIYFKLLQYFNLHKGTMTNIEVLAKEINEKEIDVLMIWEYLKNKNVIQIIDDTSEETTEDIIKEINDTMKKKVEEQKQIENDIEEIWKAYPLKKGKSASVVKLKKILLKYSKEEILKCIERYKSEVTNERYYMHGSTFFNGRYEDYLDKNYQYVDTKKSESKPMYNEFKFNY